MKGLELFTFKEFEFLCIRALLEQRGTPKLISKLSHCPFWVFFWMCVRFLIGFELLGQAVKASICLQVSLREKASQLFYQLAVQCSCAQTRWKCPTSLFKAKKKGNKTIYKHKHTQTHTFLLFMLEWQLDLHNDSSSMVIIQLAGILQDF